jgi:outer membrane protein
MRDTAVGAGMKHLLIGLAAILPAWSAASAQEATDIRVRVGAGAQLEPDFVGSKSYGIAPLFHLDFAHGADPFRFSAPDDSPSIGLLSSNGFSFGPAVNMQSPRKRSDIGAAIGSVPRTFDGGAFAQYLLPGSFRIRAELLKGINGHHGVLGSVGADKIWRDGDRYVVSVGPRMLFSDARFERAYFGVTTAASLASGLPAYRPKGGVYGVALASGANYALNNRWGVFGYGRYERLVGDAAKSPIVRDLGSRNQWSAGVGLNYIFTVPR